jgi:hypothetical protein
MEAALCAYEDKVLRLVAEHGGRPHGPLPYRGLSPDTRTFLAVTGHPQSPERFQISPFCVTTAAMGS